MKKISFRLMSALFAIIILTAVILPVFAAEKSSDKHIVRVGYFKFEGYHEIDENGVYSGYGYEYLKKMAQYNDWVFEYVGYDKSWAEMQTMLENGEIDILSSAQKTEEREKRFDFSSQPIGVSSTILTVKEGNSQFIEGDYKNYNGIRVGMLNSSTRNESFDRFAEKNGFFYTPVYFDNAEKLENALHEGKYIDAALTSSLRRADNEWVIALFDMSPYYIMVKKGNTELLDGVNYAINQVETYNPSLQVNLYEKYYSVSHDKISFTKEEKEYINSFNASGRKVTVCIKPGRMPFSGYDKDGNIVGIIGDIINYAKEKTGLPFEAVSANTRSEYNSLIESGKVIAVFDAATHLSGSTDSNQKATADYMTLQYAQLIKKQNLNKENLTVAAAKGETVTDEYIEKIYPKEKIIYYDDVKSAIEAVKNNEADCMYIDIFTAQKTAFDDYTTNTTYRICPDFYKQVSFSVNSDESPLLYSILNKVALNLDNATVQGFINSQVSYKTQNTTLRGFLYSQPIISMLMLVAFILLLAISHFFVSLRKTKKKQEQMMNEYSRFIDYVCRAYDEVVEVQVDEKKRYRYSVENGIVKKHSIPYVSGGMFSAYIHPEDLTAFTQLLEINNIQKLINEQGETYIEARCLCGDEYHWCSYTFQAIRKGGEISNNSLLYFKRDIEQAKRSEIQYRKQLREALSQAQLANEAKSMFLSRMSHEMRTPLNAILGYMSLAEKTLDDAEKTGDYLSKCQFASKHLLGIINDILDISSIESGKMKISNDSFNLVMLASSVGALFGNQAADKGIEYTTDLERITDYRIFGDRMRINQIMFNLLSNAVKFTPKGGKITFTVEQLRTVQGHIIYRFIVTDTGIGMSEEFMQRLFTPFEQQDATITKRYGGTGLGLSITNNLVKLMGGTISVKSEKDKGSTFIVELPLVPDDEYHQNEDVNEYQDDVKHDFAGKNILVAEDNFMNREIVNEILKSVHFNIDLVENGKEAVEKFKTSSVGFYDFVLMDIQMPIMDGFEASKKIRASRRDDAKTVPIIAMTANAFAQDIAASLAAGMNEHVSKPIDIPLLLRTLYSFEKDK